MQLPTTPIAREVIPRHLLCPLADRSEHQQGQGDQRDERKTEIPTEPGSYECGGKYCTFQCKSMWELEFHMEVGCGVWDSDEEQQLPVAQPQKPDDVKDQKPDDVKDQKPDVEDTKPDVSVNERCDKENTAQTESGTYECAGKYCFFQCKSKWELDFHTEVGCGTWYSDEKMPISPRDFGR